MADWTVAGEPCRVQAAGSPGTTSGGTTVTSAALNTKGSWAQLVAASGQEAGGVLVVARSTLNAIDFLLDIGVGAAAAEQAIIKDLFVGNASGFRHSLLFFAPINIPNGSRISARCQSVGGATQVIGVTVHLLGSRFNQGKPLSLVDALGTVPASTSLSVVTANAVASTKGTYTQLIASTTREYRGLAVTTNVGSAAARFGVDIAVGAAAAEQVIIPDFHVINSVGSARQNPTQPVFIPCRIPAGTRLSARCASSTGAATIGVAVHGVC